MGNLPALLLNAMPLFFFLLIKDTKMMYFVQIHYTKFLMFSRGSQNVIEKIL
jgi:hypothetical protein